MPDQIELDEGRGLSGLNPGGYDAARPDYPSWIYQRLRDERALGPNRAVIEIGAGNGLATRELLKHGADSLTIIEPDMRFATLLETLLQPGAGGGGSSCRLPQQTFETADLAPAQFDLVAAATSFHWIDQRLPFALDRQARETDLHGAGFTDVAYFQSRWTLRLTSTQVRQLYEGFSPIQRLPDVRRSGVQIREQLVE